MPYALLSPCCMPLLTCDKVLVELKHMEDMRVISKVTQPTPWCAGMVVVPKAQGKIWLYMDLTTSEQVGSEREIHPLSGRSKTIHVCKSVHKAGCILQLLANPIFQGKFTPDNIHYPIWVICIQLSTIWELFDSRPLSVLYVPDGGV